MLYVTAYPRRSATVRSGSVEPGGPSGITRLVGAVAPVVAAVILLAIGSESSAAVLDVSACVSTTALSISADPKSSCPADRLVQAVAASLTVSNAVTDFGGLSGRVSSGFQLTKQVDRTSVTLFFDAVSGAHLASVLIAFYNTDPANSGIIYSILLQDVTIISLVTTGVDQQPGGLPLTVVTFKYAKITVKDANGVQKCWDLAQGQPC